MCSSDLSVVRLEPLRPDHAGALAQAARGDRTSYALTWVPDGPDQARAYVEQRLRWHAEGAMVPFAVRRLADGAVVGATTFCSLLRLPDDPRGTPEPVADAAPPHAVEVGHTWYQPAAQRSGVNADAKLLLLTHAFERWRVLRVSLCTDARNARSRGAIERLGARLDGVERVARRAEDGGVRDTARYSVLAQEWPVVRAGLLARRR